MLLVALSLGGYTSIASGLIAELGASISISATTKQ
jgi:hypothetical protein